MKIENEKILFATGMFRSGGTLLGRMLNTHPKITLGTDTHLEFFKAYRNELFQQNNCSILDPNMPLEHNFKSKNLVVNQIIEKSNFEIDFKFEQKNMLFDRIKKFSQKFSPIYVSKLNSLKGNNFEDVFSQMLQAINDAYGKENEEYIGFKSGWSEQFVAPFLNQYNERGRVIFFIRDPRAVIASNFVKKNHRYPLEFLIREWRKSVTYAILYTKILQKFKDKCMLIRYEDLISNPKKSIEKMMTFLQLDYDNKLLQPSKYVDGNNQPWKQNTNYSDAKTEFNENSISKWKTVLEKNIQQFIEYSCYPEMNELGYKFETVNENSLMKNFEYPIDKTEEIALWIEDIYPKETLLSSKWLRQIQQDENERNMIFLNFKKQYTKQVIQEYFIDERYFEHITKRLEDKNNLEIR